MGEECVSTSGLLFLRFRVKSGEEFLISGQSSICSRGNNQEERFHLWPVVMAELTRAFSTTVFPFPFCASVWGSSMPAQPRCSGRACTGGSPELVCLTLSPLGREDAVAPKTPSWARRPASDTMSKTSTLSSLAGSRQAYGARAPSDTASILTTTGSYRGPPPRAGGRPPGLSPPAVNGTSRRRQDPAAAPGGSVPPSSLARAGAVPVMVPAQSRAGSLV